MSQAIRSPQREHDERDGVSEVAAARGGLRGRRLLIGGVALLAVLGGCATAPPRAVSLPSGPAVVDVVEQDLGYVLEGEGEIRAGRAVFRIRNGSRLSHDLSLVALPEDLPPIKEQLRSPERRAVATLARLASRPPGSKDALAVDLTPGRYALLCFEQDGAGGTHALNGMAVEFRVTTSPSGKPPRP